MRFAFQGPAGKLKEAARRVWTPTPSKGGWGLTAEELTQPPLEVWPENWDVAEFFTKLGMGCWAFSYSGVVGLRPEAVEIKRKTWGINRRKFREMEDDLSVMEMAAVNYLRRDQ